MYKVVLLIKGLPKTPNNLLGAHWTIRSSEAKKWLRAVINAISLNGKIPETPLERARIECVRMSSGRMDDDNLRGSFKSVIDALKKCGVIKDDSPDHVLVTYSQTKAPPGGGKIKVSVEEVL
jgi:Holliday junction resolvase RusA-like endonuclease